MNARLRHHLIDHAPRGFGDSPDNCPVCPHTHQDLVDRLTAVESKSGTNRTLMTILTGVTTSFVAAFLVEKIVRKK